MLLKYLLRQNFLVLFFLILSSLILPAQDNFEERVKEEYVLTCDEISSQVMSKLINDYLPENKLDSARFILKFWIEKCDTNLHIQTANILLDIKENKFSPGKLSGSNFGIMRYLVAYQKHVGKIYHGYIPVRDEHSYIDYGNDYRSYLHFKDVDSSYYAYMQVLATELLREQDSTADSWLVCKVISDPKFKFIPFIKQDNNSAPITKAEADDIKQNILLNSATVVGWHTGLWVPQGDLKDFGLHPIIGVYIGGIESNISNILSAELKFLSTTSPYSYIKEGREYKSSSFVGMDFSWDLHFPLYYQQRNSINVLCGLGYDFFQADYGKGVFFDSMVLNLGLSATYFYEENDYIGITLKYRYMDYSDDFFSKSGNSITISISFGKTVYNPYQLNL